MKETGKNQEIDNLIEEELQKAFGYDEESLIAEFDRAAQQMDDSEWIPPEGEFERIAARVKAGKKGTSKKVIRLKRVGKLGLLVAILGGVLMGTGIGASGKRAYEYSIRSYAQGQKRVWNNAEFIDGIKTESELVVEDAYQEIKDKLGIDSLRLIRIPKGMSLSKLSFGEGYARMKFTRGEDYICFIQSQFPVEDSGNTTSDRTEKADDPIVLNRNLNLELKIKKYKLSNKKVEYSSEFVIDKTYYYLAGVISEEEFKQVLRKISN